MLELRPNCECCNKDISPNSANVYICSLECTFCEECARERLGFACPNCGGELLRRPVRPNRYLRKYPPSTKRVYQPEGCPPKEAVAQDEVVAG